MEMELLSKQETGQKIYKSAEHICPTYRTQICTTTKWSAQGDGGKDGVVVGWCGVDWVAQWREMMVDGWVMWSSEVAEARRHDGLAAAAAGGGRRSGEGERDGDARPGGDRRRWLGI